MLQSRLHSPCRNHAPGRRGGFTLIELLVVIGILALLVGLLMPSLGRAKQLARRAVCGSNLHQVSLGFAVYRQMYDDAWPCTKKDPVAGQTYWLWMGRGWRAMMAPIFQTKIDKFNPSVLLCPGDAANRDKFEATSYSYSMSFYHSPDQINTLNAKADTYSNPQDSIVQRESNVKYPGAKILAGDWTANHPAVPNDPGWWTWAGARNYLFADGHVVNLDATEITPARDNFPDPNLTVDGIAGRDVK